MFKAFLLAALIFGIKAQNFTNFTVEGTAMQYRVINGTLEFNMFLAPLTKKSKGCQDFFGLPKLKLPYTQIGKNGFTIECNDLKKPYPFGVNLKVFNVPTEELGFYERGDITFSRHLNFDSLSYLMAANTTCLGNCTKTFAGKTANVLSYNANLLPGQNLSSLKLATDHKSTDMRAEEIVAALAG